MSIATQRGDSGQTSLAGGSRVSKADGRVDTYGTIDELISCMGFARAICDVAEVRDLTRELQRELFTVGGGVAAPEDSARKPPAVETAWIERLTEQVHRIEALPGLLDDWALPGEHPAAAAYDVARTVCRRAERGVVRLIEAGVRVQPPVVAYLNRLSDLLWLFSRQIEKEAGVDAHLRDGAREGPKWSRAW